jgi:aspartate carbamoyltransferase catalytic subunit
LLAISDLTSDQIHRILSIARVFSKDQKPPTLLSGKTVVNLFMEASTRTRISFEVATRKLGGAVLNFSPGSSSVEKGETLLDTARNILAMKPDCLVVRHSASGAPDFLSKALNVPIVNAGDGFHEHPTQALLDLYTLQEALGDLNGKRVVILGDIAHSRVARSNITALQKVGAHVSLCGPPTFLPPAFKKMDIEYSYRPEELLEKADAVMALRVQLERQNHLQLPTLGEYRRFWGLTVERAARMKPGAVILHPGPINRGIEIDPEVADGSSSVILGQVASGVLVRMATLAIVCNPKGLDEYV